MCVKIKIYLDQKAIAPPSFQASPYSSAARFLSAASYTNKEKPRNSNDYNFLKERSMPPVFKIRPAPVASLQFAVKQGKQWMNHSTNLSEMKVVGFLNGVKIKHFYKLD